MRDKTKKTEKTGLKSGTHQVVDNLDQRIIATIREPLVVLDGDLRVICVNDSFCRTFQVLPSQTKDRLFFELGHNQWDVPRLRQLLENILIGNQDFQDFEVEYVFPETGRRTMLLNARRLTRREGEADGFILLAIEDVTERQRTEAALRETHARLTALIEAAPDPIFFKDVQGRYLVINQAAAEMAGFRREDFIGKTDAQLFPSEVAAQLRSNDAKVISQLQPLQVEEYVNNTKGQKIFVQTVKFPLFDDQGKIRGVGGLARDLTQHKVAEEALRRSEERYRLIAENIQEVFWMATPAIDRMVYISPAYEEIWGRSCASLYESPTSFIDAIHPEDRNRVLAVLDRHRSQGTAWITTYRVVRPDGSIRWVEDHGFPILDEQGKCYLNTGVAVDITLRQEAETALRERTAQLEAANMELEAFSYSVSHDLKAPIRAIQGFSRMLLREHADKLDAEGHRLLQVVCDNTNIMHRLVDDLLSLSRLGRVQIRNSEINMAAMAKQVFEELRSQAPERDLRLTVGDLPPTMGDQALLRQVLENLLSNAIKYTRPRKTAVIEVGGKDEANYTVFYVKDNGVGFDEHYADKLFGVFQRLHSGAEYEGTGVGLALVKRLIQRHGGRVWAEGKVEEGATFYFALPKHGLRSAI